MKRLLILIAVLTFGCSGMMPKSEKASIPELKIEPIRVIVTVDSNADYSSEFEKAGSAPTYGTKSTGDSYTSSEHNELYNAVVDNDTRLDTIEELGGIVWSDGDGTYTEFAISAVELDRLDGITGALYYVGGTDVAVTDGGTGSSTASGARTNLGLAIGTDVLAPDGDGSSLTGVDAATGDSATSFFDTGTCEHERGCLETDLSAYAGFPVISGGATSQGIEFESDCSDNTSGLCIDSDDYKIYRYNGSNMVELGSGVLDTDYDGDLSDETPEFSTVTATQFIGLVIGDCSDGDNCTADEILDNENISPTGGSWDLSALTLTFPAGGWYFADEDSSPDTAGQIKYDNNITGLNDGGIVWYDDDEIKYLLDYATLPSAQGQIPEYNSTTDKWEPVQRGHINSTAKTSAYTIGTDLSEECYGGVFYVTSAATLTACDGLTAGMNFTVVTIGATAVSLDVQSDDLMYLDGTALDDGDKATNTSTTGDTITCVYYDATGWYCWSGSPDGDHWTDGGP